MMTMRKPISKKQQELKKQKRMQLLFSLFIAAVMVFSIAGFALQQHSSRKTVKLYGHKFYFTDGLWHTNVMVNNKQVSLTTTILPNQTVPLPNITLDDFSDKVVYTAISPNFDAYNLAFLLSLISAKALRIQPCCLETWQYSYCKQLPRKTCSKTSQSIVVVFNSSNITQVNFDDCLLVNADVNSTNVVVDSLVFALLGLTKNI